MLWGGLLKEDKVSEVASKELADLFPVAMGARPLLAEVKVRRKQEKEFKLFKHFSLLTLSSCSKLLLGFS